MLHKLPSVSPEESDKIAEELSAPILNKASEMRRRDYQKELGDFVGEVSLKKISGRWYQSRPIGWRAIDSLDDLIMDDPAPVPISQRLRTRRHAEIKTAEGAKQLTINAPQRKGDMSENDYFLNIALQLKGIAKGRCIIRIQKARDHNIIYAFEENGSVLVSSESGGDELTGDKQFTLEMEL